MGEDLFELVPIYGKLFVSESHLCQNPEVAEAHLDDYWLQPLLHHWFDIIDSPYFEETDEIMKLSRLNELYPDNVIVVVDKLQEYSRLNRTYANDDLYTTDSIFELIQKV